MTAPNTLGIDFGTSNSAAGIAVAGRPWLVEMEPGEQTLPTAVFFDEDSRSMRIGHSATRALINGDEGRFMRALKSLLGTPLLHEERRLGGERISFGTLIARFLAEMKQRAETATHMEFTHALSGRPVRFHSKDEDRNIQAEKDLRACYLEAGFQDVLFLYEPEAALRAAAPAPGCGLIVDIGGGTSDFTAFEQDANGATRILASHGVRLGGTDFDRQLSIHRVMPLLGRGSQIRNSFGGGTLPAPNRLFNDLATWQMIPFLYSPESRRAAKDLAANAVEPDRLARLVDVLEDELGHELAFAVERGKIQANTAGGAAAIDLKLLQRGLSVPLPAAEMNQTLAEQTAAIGACAAETLAQAGLPAASVDRIVLVGGSSLLGAVQAQMRSICPNARVETGNAMTAVADGLALAAGTAFA
ncbi:Hsp70 family protein [Leisingera sp. HS039]|uniref:Hsp70 family protein n=1 Tax=unclassified Leisingera TaxID=2614906 RepID=UPI001071065C|nr:MULTISPECIES: Hsp70 family protein [unclassified Leisingera]MBQ4823430.1 Hsp70 family protein [Leisingera sp. HS039]QBR36524.1 Hsp70 family protein [Leisingera sp. NJS201]